MLHPRIKTDEKFRMTVEHNGRTYTFEGIMEDFNLEVNQDYSESIGDGLWITRVPTFRHFQVNMTIRGMGSPVVHG